MVKNKIRILQFPLAASMGGRSQYILNIWDNIDRNRFHFDFVTFAKDLKIPTNHKIGDGMIYYIQNYPRINIDGFKKEFEGILRNNYDVVEIHTSFWQDTIVEELSKKMGVKRVIIHGHSSGISLLSVDDKSADKAMLDTHYQIKGTLSPDIATDFWACSNEAATWLFRPTIPSDMIRIIPNAIDTKRFRYNSAIRHESRKKLNIYDELVIGFVGRFEPVKNLEFLMKVFIEVHKIFNRTKLLLVGDGKLRDRLRDVSVREKIETDVIFVGTSDSPEYWYQAMDYFLMPSFFEGFPLTVLEAQCCGLNCIISDTITEAVCLTMECKRLSLENTDKWVDEIISNKDKINRNDNSDLLFKLGLDIKLQIHELEELYSMDSYI